MLVQKINTIYEKYIMDNCPQPINIKSNVRAQIMKRMQLEDYEVDMFKTAKQEIYDLMSLDVFARFKHSESFKKMLDEIGVYGAFAGEVCFFCTLSLLKNFYPPRNPRRRFNPDKKMLDCRIWVTSRFNLINDQSLCSKPICITA